MTDALVSRCAWILIRLPQLLCRSRKVADHVDPSELASPILCLYFEVAFPGGCCRHNWVAVLT
jgi:hypothetical protein